MFPAHVNPGESSTTNENEVSGIGVLQEALRILESSGQNVLPDLTANRGTETTMSYTRSWTNPHVQVRIFSINIESVFCSLSID